MECHWEEIRIEITEVQESPSPRDKTPEESSKDQMPSETSDDVASGMHNLFVEGKEGV
jgi:hypothetical protein